MIGELKAFREFGTETLCSETRCASLDLAVPTFTNAPGALAESETVTEFVNTLLAEALARVINTFKSSPALYPSPRQVTTMFVNCCLS